MARKIDLDLIWPRAVQLARLDVLTNDAEAAEAKTRLALDGPVCPISIDYILACGSDPARLIAHLCDAVVGSAGQAGKA